MEEAIAGMNMSVQSADFIAKEARANTALTAVRICGKEQTMRLIDADKLIEHITNTADLGGWIGEALQQIKQVAIKYINLAPTITTKQIKYFDEDESVWKIRQVIVDE